MLTDKTGRPLNGIETAIAYAVAAVRARESAVYDPDRADDFLAMAAGFREDIRALLSDWRLPPRLGVVRSGLMNVPPPQGHQSR